ncbi:MAG: DUF1214 domain-containing protein [Polyangiaceae bacterium]
MAGCSDNGDSNDGSGGSSSSGNGGTSSGGSASEAGSGNEAGAGNVVVPDDVQAAADAAFEYGYPLTEMMRVCDTHPAVNHAFPKTALATPEETTIVLPNNDTLYTTACLYLGGGWVKLTMPPRNERYMSAEIFDAYTNNVALASARDLPAAGQSYILHQAGTSLDGIPDGLPVWEVPTPYAFALIRTLVNGPSDLDAAVDVERGISFTPSSNTAPVPFVPAPSSTTAQDFFLKLMGRLAQNPPPKSESDLVASFDKAGVRPSLTPDLAQVSDVQLAAWETAYANGFNKLQTAAPKVNSQRGQWSFPNPKLAMPGNDYALRAVIARYGIFPLPPTESIYPRTQGDGSVPHVLHLPAEWAPIEQGGFWSLTMYSNGYLVDNPINRYSIGDRTPGVVREADGTLKLYLQCTDPGGELSANWLPTPCGPFSMTMRLYLPTAVAQDATFTLPELE